MAKRPSNISTLKGFNQYKNYFSTDKSHFFHTGKDGWGAGYRPAVKKITEGGELRPVGNIKDGKTFIKASYLPKHFQMIEAKIDMSLWWFIQIMGSRTERVFKDSFTNKSFRYSAVKVKNWTKLTKDTKDRRMRLNLWNGKKMRGNILSATNRLENSIKMQTVKATNLPLARIYTDEDSFSPAYPEWRGSKNATRNHNGRMGSKYPVGPTPYTDINGYELWGRKGRIYAGVHNSKSLSGSSIPERKFIGITDFLMSQSETKIMDDILFYGIFNQNLGFSRGKIKLR